MLSVFFLAELGGRGDIRFASSAFILSLVRMLKGGAIGGFQARPTCLVAIFAVYLAKEPQSRGYLVCSP